MLEPLELKLLELNRNAAKSRSAAKAIRKAVKHESKPRKAAKDTRKAVKHESKPQAGKGRKAMKRASAIEGMRPRKAAKRVPSADRHLLPVQTKSWPPCTGFMQ